LRFLNFFNDPRIIREQRIAAYNGYRRGGVVQVLKSVLGVYLYPFEDMVSKKGFQSDGDTCESYRVTRRGYVMCWIG
ncbi:hypothetical protein Tco_1207225, partial [Tanacetum coccineum]